MSDTFKVGDRVSKPKGYPYPGTVVALFENLAGEARLVVESELAPGMLHIFSPKQLEVEKTPLPSAGWGCSDCRHNHSGQYVPEGENKIFFDGRCLNDIFGPSCGCTRRRPEKKS